ncbi:lactonase family protein [Devosia sp.]|uniref:lactonase family protein n=1 Tax=Devosia sp. TaxID=1871048 RepID=UPI002AFFC855|nr:beta-propeller fold lactonase family protein [Devosia sp.]
MADAHDAVFAYVGNWKIDGDDLGITICRLDSATATLEPLRTVMPGICVGAMYLDRDRDILYCADERSNNPDLGPGSGGRVFAFRIDPETGDLVEMSRNSAYASLTSYITTDVARDYLLATNHARPIQITTAERDENGMFRVIPVADPATTALFRLDPDGGIGEICDIHHHHGPRSAPHWRSAAAHCVVPSPDGRFFVVCDKGTDEVLLFGIDCDTHRLILTGRLAEPDGTAPRYAVFHPSAPHFYVNHERAPFITTFRYDEKGRVERLGEAEVLPADGAFALAEAEPSDLLFDPSGRFLYSLVRRCNAISVFEVDVGTGGLRRVQTLRIEGDNPRGAAFTADGKFLLVALVGTAAVASLGVQPDGTLIDTGRRTSFTRPGCVVVRAG